MWMDKNKKYGNLNFGPYPTDDGWLILYKLYNKFIKPNFVLRFIVLSYFLPLNVELTKNRKLYRFLGINKLGKYIPTGGISVRRITKTKMKPYTLKSTNVNSAREFLYRTIVFEFLHLPFFVAMTVLVIHRFYIGEYRFAMENFLINLLLNIIPMLHHRNTRARIVELLMRKSDLPPY